MIIVDGINPIIRVTQLQDSLSHYHYWNIFCFRRTYTLAIMKLKTFHDHVLVVSALGTYSLCFDPAFMKTFCAYTVSGI